MSETAKEMLTHPDIFTPSEGAAFLRLPNRRALARRAREFGIRPARAGMDYIFSREQLEFIRRQMFGMEPTKKQS